MSFCMLGFITRVLQVANFVIMILLIIAVLGKSSSPMVIFVPNVNELLFLCLVIIAVNVFSLLITVIKNHYFLMFYYKTHASNEQNFTNQMSKHLAIAKVFAKFLQACFFVIIALLGLAYFAPQIGVMALLALFIMLCFRQVISFSEVSKFRRLLFSMVNSRTQSFVNLSTQKDIKTDISISADNVIASLLFVLAIILFDTLEIPFDNLGSVLFIIFCIRYIFTYSIDAVRSIRKLKSFYEV